jgi:hypothetical protein
VTGAEYFNGALVLGIVLGCAAVCASVLVARHRAADLAGVPRAVAWGVIAAAFVYFAHLIPGILGGLAAGTVVATAVMLTAVALSIPERFRRPDVPEAPAPAREPRWVTWIGAGAVVAVATYLLGWALDNGGIYLGQQDVVSFHLPNVIQWVQDGSLWGIHDWIPNRAPGNYPQTGDVFMLAAILPWDSDFAVRFVTYPFVALMGMAIYAAGRELTAPPGTAALVAAAVAAMPAVSYIAVSGLADPEMLGLFAAGAFFLLRHWRTGDWFDLAIAGIGLGLAFGARWYAVPAVGAVLLVWAVARWRRGRAGFAAETGALAGLVALAGGFWLLRNWIESGNPVFPVEVAPLGLALFDAPRDVYRELYGFTLANYVTDFDVIGEHIWPRFLDFLSFTSLAVWAAALAGGVLAVRRGGPSAGPVLAIAAVSAIIFIAYIGTPYTGAGEEGAPFEAWVNSRYVIPALVCGAPALAWLIGTRPGLLAIAAPLLGIATLDALRRSGDFPGGGVGAAALFGGLVLLVLAAVAAFIVIEIQATRRSRGFALATGLAIFAAAVAIGAWQEDRFSDGRYEGLGPEVDYVNEAPAGSRVGIVGDGFVNYPLFGPSLENEVSYVGRRREEMLRPHTRFEAFERALRGDRYDFIAWRSLDTLDEELPFTQAAWLDRLGWRRVEHGDNPLLNSEVAIYLPPREREQRG